MPCSLFYLCYSYTKSGTALFKNFHKGRAAAGVTADNVRSFTVHLSQRTFDHLMGHGICEKYQDVRTSYLFV